MKLYPSSYLRGRSLLATDGEIGRCHDFLFDIHHWTIRYLVVDTRKWLPGRKVVISPSDVDIPSIVEEGTPIRVHLSQDEIRESPPLDEHATISMQLEERLSTYYGWPAYWAGSSPWGESATVPLIEPNREILAGDAGAVAAMQGAIDETPSRLRSTAEIQSYHIETTDGELGHIEEVSFDLEAWTIRYVILDTRNWFGGRKLAIPRDWFDKIDAIAQTAQIKRNREAAKACPEVDPKEVMDHAEVETLESAFA